MTTHALAADPAPVRAPGKTLFGHPRGLTFLFATEMWERFSYYGMRALLTLYMVEYLFQPGVRERVWGYPQLQSGLESVFGPLGVQALSSQVYGIYTALVYLTPVFGGMLADRVLGQRRTVVIGALLMAAGHFVMAFEALFLPALLLIILGNGAFKPNISTQVGGLYEPGDARRDRAYSIFYVGINLGAFFSPLVCGRLGYTNPGEAPHWGWGFAAAGVGMLVATVIYLIALRTLPPDERAIAKRSRTAKKPLDRLERRAVGALVLIALLTVFFWACYEQQGNTTAVWAAQNMDLTVALFGRRLFDLTPPDVQAFNPFMIFAFTPLIVAFWAWQAKRGREPSTVMKMAIGCAIVGLANLLMMLPAAEADAGVKTSWLWVFGHLALVTTGELYLSPVALSLFSRVSPARIVSMMMGVYFLSSFFGNYLSGWLGSFWESMSKVAFFGMIAAIAFVTGLAIAAFNRPLKPILDRAPERDLALAAAE